MSARPFIDSLDFARNAREISGVVPVAGMPRLLDALENPEGTLSYMVRGGVGRQGNPFLDVNLSGRCKVICQRCLESMDYPVWLDVRLLLSDQAGLDALDDSMADGEDEADSILADAHLDVLDLLEDEILLSLPIAPKHETGACQAAGGEGEKQEEKHPFAALAKLKVVR